MNRFKAFKYRNAVAKPAKKENWFLDINIGNLKLSCGNHITASSKQMVFNMEFRGGGSLGVLNLDDIGRRNKAPPHLHCHSDFVSDMAFSPFLDESLLATCSYDCSIKLWKLPDNVTNENVPSSAASVLPIQPNRVENVVFHPSASEVLTSSCSRAVTVWDLEKCQKKYEVSNHNDTVQSFSWKGDGSLLATTSKDKKVRIFDPRASSCIAEGSSFGSVKESRVTWVGDRNLILGTGFSQSRQRQVVVWDINNLSSPLQAIDIDVNTGVLMPFYDSDAHMLLLAGKGDSSILYYEVKEGENLCLSQVSGEMMGSQSKGMALVPKCAMDVMACEVVRLLQLTSHAIVPVSYIVPRKNTKDFQGDLFPDTLGNTPSMTCQQWFRGESKPRRRVSLDPYNKTLTRIQEQEQVLKDLKCIKGEASEKPSKPLSSPSDTSSAAKKIFANLKTSKFRHIYGVPMHKSNNIENIRNLSVSTLGECDGLQVNDIFVSWLLSGPGGQIAVHPLSKPCRLPDTGLPMIQCGSTVLDFAFDPFNNHRIATACESGSIYVWNIPKGGLQEVMDKPIIKLSGHYGKPTILKYHPTASDIVASASVDLSIKIWDICMAQGLITLQGHSEQIFSFCWSLDGKYIASVSRDKKIRVYEPRSSTQCTKIGNGPEGSRGARIFWAGSKSELIVTSGFDKSSSRILAIYDRKNLCEPLQVLSLEVAPSILIPSYDEDSGVVMLSGKGDTVVFGFEIQTEPPYILELSHYRIHSPLQAIGFQDKRFIDVRSVEVARGIKLSKTNIEFIQFKVPRLKIEFFQDDLYPDTKIKWQPALSGKDWFLGKNEQLKTMSLRPMDMKALSEIPEEQPVAKKYNSTTELQDYKSDEQKKEMLVTAMVKKLGNYDEDPLPQDLMEGVDDDEWDD